MYNQPPQQPLSYYPYPQIPLLSTRRRFPIVRVILLILLALVLVVGYFIFTAKPRPDGYLNTEDTSTEHILRYLTWTESDGQLTGYWSIADVEGHQKPDYGNGDLTGTQNGDQISITAHTSIGVSQYTDTGTLEGNTLTLQAPMPDGTIGTLTYQGVSQQQYDQSLSDFKTSYGG